MEWPKNDFGASYSVVIDVCHEMKMRYLQYVQKVFSAQKRYCCTFDFISFESPISQFRFQRLRTPHLIQLCVVAFYANFDENIAFEFRVPAQQMDWYEHSHIHFFYAMNYIYL